MAIGGFANRAPSARYALHPGVVRRARRASAFLQGRFAGPAGVRTGSGSCLGWLWGRTGDGKPGTDGTFSRLGQTGQTGNSRDVLSSVREGDRADRDRRIPVAHRRALLRFKDERRLSSADRRFFRTTPFLRDETTPHGLFRPLNEFRLPKWPACAGNVSQSRHCFRRKLRSRVDADSRDGQPAPFDLPPTSTRRWLP